MSIIIRRILIVNSHNRDIAVDCLNKFARQLGKLSGDLQNPRISVLTESDKLEAGFIQIAYEAEISDPQRYSSLNLGTDADEWFSEWLKEANEIGLDSWIETWEVVESKPDID